MLKEYEGTCMVGVVGPEGENGECRDSIQKLQLRMGDDGPRLIRATKGYEARQYLFDMFLESNHAFLLLLDHDQVYPPDTLERLRSHKLPYVSGYYLRRTNKPLAPVWYELGERGAFPLMPWTTEPERGKLHELGASGWGCILVHREVAEAVKALLKGEDLVIEDDMDVWPYDLAKVMDAVNGIGALLTEWPAPRIARAALAHYHEVLSSEIRPLRGMKDPIGSDIRFPFFAREAGYILMGDPDARIGHILNYQLSPDDFTQVGEEYRENIRKNLTEARQKEVETIQKLRQELAQ